MTHTFKLPSGVECELSELTGKQQRILTEQNKKPHNEKLAEMLASILVRVGSKTDIDEKFIKEKMLTCDRNAALVEARQFSLDFEDEFVFMHTYKGADGQKHTVEISEKVPEGRFPSTPVKKLNAKKEYEPANYSEYEEIEKDILIELPRSKKKVRFTLLDGSGEKIGVSTSKTKRSSHTPIKMRNPVYFEQGKKDVIPVSLNLDNLGIKDIEFLRKKIKEFEGRVDTEIMFDHPVEDKQEILDVISTVAFFFPSEAI
jgi:hypothetical protein